MTITTFIIIIILAILFLLSIVCISFLLVKNKKLKESEFVKKYDVLNNKLINQEKKLESEIINYKNKLLSLSNKTEIEIENEIKNNLSNKLKKELINEINDYKQELKKNKTEILSNLLIDSYQNILEETIHQSSATIIKLDDINLKGRIIGKDGRNKKIFEYLTGTDLVIDKVSEYITIASLNPIRRTIANNVMVELIKSKNIEPSKIETLYEQEYEKFNNEIYELGKKTCLEKLKVDFLNEKIYPYIGKLNYRSSYSQNILSHSLECAYIAQKIAEALGVDQTKAKLAAFFHDIGKANDFEIDKNHIESGVGIANECNLDDYIKESILTHHNEGIVTSIYSEITKIVDTISASRPGARIDSYEEYIKRVNILEKICNEFEEVNSSFVIKSGRQLRVMVNPRKVSNYDELELLSLKIKDAIENDSEVGTYKIKVVMIKEDKFSFETSQNKELKIDN